MGLGTLEKGSNIYSGYILRVEGAGFAEGVNVWVMRGRTQG